MKNLLTLFLILSNLYVFAQDGYSLPESSYNTILQNISLTDSLTARTYAEQLVNANSGYQFYKAKQSKQTAVFYFIEKGLSDETLKDQEELGCSKCMRVMFSTYNNQYKFESVTGALDKILPIWQQEFIPSATNDLVKQNFKYREVNNRDTGLKVRMQHSGGVWTIYNWSV
ncbi:hypothetical protein [Formosa sp. A9]|uniref:hypothetical protein n=1 Tax=Formosa sp. A9 TaxID=3442641 RepID=UPI003EB8C20C